MVVSAVREQIPEGAEFQLATVLVHVMMPTTKAMKKKKNAKNPHIPALQRRARASSGSRQQ